MDVVVVAAVVVDLVTVMSIIEVAVEVMEVVVEVLMDAAAVLVVAMVIPRLVVVMAVVIAMAAVERGWRCRWWRLVVKQHRWYDGVGDGGHGIGDDAKSRIPDGDGHSRYDIKFICNRKKYPTGILNHLVNVAVIQK